MVRGWDLIGKANSSFLSCEAHHFRLSAIDLIARTEGNFILGFWLKPTHKETRRNMVITSNITVITEVSDRECH
ncbi:Uncharacterised protein [Vibrio cholerae]|nr:Uncharacterised protein [Vibrio cholerae]CSB40856.1 Uncharacterised protein [Vibrio cholerae]CSC70068.1 Uncharacterised protein [Vibrio cholerae]CSI42792.1 Uncharacterised protein [Vibrio cholerae]